MPRHFVLPSLLSLLSVVVAREGVALRSAPIEVLWFDLAASAAVEALSYEEQMLAFVFQGLVNGGASSAPNVIISASANV